jgi:hypothetical protein
VLRGDFSYQVITIDLIHKICHCNLRIYSRERITWKPTLLWKLWKLESEPLDLNQVARERLGNLHCTARRTPSSSHFFRKKLWRPHPLLLSRPPPRSPRHEPRRSACPRRSAPPSPLRLPPLRIGAAASLGRLPFAAAVLPAAPGRIPFTAAVPPRRAASRSQRQHPTSTSPGCISAPAPLVTSQGCLPFAGATRARPTTTGGGMVNLLMTIL